MKFKVMYSVGALPTEQRVQELNDAQIIWYYYNLIEYEKEQHKMDKQKLDYLGLYIDYEKASIMLSEDNDNKINIKNNNVKHGTDDQTTYDYKDDDFERKLQESINEEEELLLTELPGEGDIIGDPTLTQDEFITKVEEYFKKYDEENKSMNPLEIKTSVFSSFVDEDDVDIIVVDE